MAPIIETDIINELVRALEKTERELEESSQDPYNWKWLIGTLQNALQCAMVAALTQTDLTGALTEPPTRQLREHQEGTRSFEDVGRLRIASIRELAVRTHREFLIDARATVTRLAEYRNEFAHFPPIGWSLDAAGLPGIALGALAAIRELAGPLNGPMSRYWPRREHEHDQIVRLLNRIDQNAQTLRDEYEGLSLRDGEP